jgi:hypothetical protein
MFYVYFALPKFNFKWMRDDYFDVKKFYPIIEILNLMTSLYLSKTNYAQIFGLRDSGGFPRASMYFSVSKINPNSTYLLYLISIVNLLKLDF